jgi:hypothetical protein
MEVMEEVAEEDEEEAEEEWKEFVDTNTGQVYTP